MGIAIDIRKKLGDFQLAVQWESEASRIGILGASGCGKSMTLKCIAGIETPDEGRICVAGHTIKTSGGYSLEDEKTLFDSKKKVNVKPQQRGIGYLFQNYALFPHMTVEQNIAAGLKRSKTENQKRVQEMIQKFRLTGLEKHLPGQLSGGQQQRTALARIMAYEPDMILLDEPFSALDGFLKDRLQLELEEMLEDYPGIIIMVSHNRDEVYRFCEELVIMDKGAVVVNGDTKDLFASPRYKEAAKLTGCKNFSAVRRIDAHTAELTDWGITLKIHQELPDDCTSLGYRAHDFIPIWGEPRENCLKVQVLSKAELPFEVQYYLWPEKQEKSISGEENVICWFTQRQQQPLLAEKGLPDYLQIAEEKCMFLSNSSASMSECVLD